MKAAMDKFVIRKPKVMSDTTNMDPSASDVNSCTTAVLNNECDQNATTISTSENSNCCPQLIEKKQQGESLESDHSDVTVPTISGDQHACPYEEQQNPGTGSTATAGLGHSEPMQPILSTFPKTTFGKRIRCFSADWYAGRKWLEYCPEQDAIFCFACRNFLPKNDRDVIFTVTGFKNWKTALENGRGLDKHAQSKAHLSAMSFWSEKETRGSKGLQVQQQLCVKQLEKNRYYVKAIAEVVKFLATNELGFRGTQETADGENRGLFLNLLEYTISKDAVLRSIVPTIPANAKYTSPEIQNEIIDIMVQMVLEDIVSEVNAAPCFTIKCDETRDSVGIENMSIVVRYVNGGRVKEEFIGLTALAQFDAQYMCDIILNRLAEIGLDSSKIISQCYDGAAVMCGRLGGVQALLQDKLKKCIPYVHCFNHLLHLVVVSVMGKEKVVEQFFDMCGGLYNFTRKGKVAALYDGSALHRLLEHRWTGHLETTNAVLSSIDQLTELLQIISESTSFSSDVTIEAGGLLRLLERRDLRFAGLIVQELLTVLKPLNLLLQAKEIDLHSASTLVNSTLEILKSFRDENSSQFQLPKFLQHKLLSDPDDKGITPRAKRRRMQSS